MRRLISITLVSATLLFSNSVLADLYGDDYKKTLDVSVYEPTQMDIRKSLLRVMVANNWTNFEQTPNSIQATYRNAVVKISIDKSTIAIEEVPTNALFDERWMKSLENHLLKDLAYYQQLRIAERIMVN